MFYSAIQDAVERLARATLSSKSRALVGATLAERASGAASSPGPTAFLSSITVEGFRGVGAAQSLNLAAKPGLTLVLGRNSTIAHHRLGHSSPQPGSPPGARHGTLVLLARFTKHAALPTPPIGFAAASTCVTNPPGSSSADRPCRHSCCAAAPTRHRGHNLVNSAAPLKCSRLAFGASGVRFWRWLWRLWAPSQ